MEINYKKISIVFLSILTGIYGLFLILPFVISPFISSYSKQLEDIIKNSTGLEAKIEGLGITTSPKFTAGIKIKELNLYIPKEKAPFFKTDKFTIDLAILPLILKNIQLNKISANTIHTSINLKKDGTLCLIDYIKLPEENNTDGPITSLPFGLKLSNRLPDIRTNKYHVSIIDFDKKSYFIEGEKFNIKDFVLNKKVKLSTHGKIQFQDHIVSNYDIKINNNIMPETDLNNLIFRQNTPTNSNTPPKETPSTPELNLSGILNTIYKNKLRADINADIKTTGSLKKPQQQGYIKIDNLSVNVNGKELPKSYAHLIFKGSKTDIDSLFYTSDNKTENTKLTGQIKSGPDKYLNLTLRSNAGFNNIIRLLDSIAQSVSINDMKPIKATGGIDADFNIVSDFKKITSNGYLKIKPSSLKHEKYNVNINNITSDINFENNNIKINNTKLNVMGHELKLSGSVLSDTQTDIKLNADKLPVKGLIALAGQNNLLKENNIKNGTLSANAILKGKLSEIKPDLNISLNNLDIYNIPNKIKLTLSNAIINLILKKENKLSGNIKINSLTAKNQNTSVSVPNADITITDKDININKDSYLKLNNSRINLTGIIQNYTSTNILNIDLNADGNLNTKDIMSFVPKEIHSMFPYKGNLPLNIKINGNTHTQSISLNLNADKNNYIRFAEIDLLKNKTTKIHSDMKLASDTLTFTNTGISANNTSIATLSGSIDKLSTKQILNLKLSVPQNVSFPIWGLKNSNITALGNINISGSIQNPELKGTIKIPDISAKDFDFSITNIIGHLNNGFFTGNAQADQLKFGNIIATNLKSKVSLNKSLTDFNLTDMTGDAFKGKLKGKLLYNIPTFGIKLVLSGENINSTDAIYGAAGIKNALTGDMNFNTNLTMKGLTDKELIESMKGNIDFKISDGRFVSIGKLENLVAAQNINSISVLKSFISALSTLSTVQKSDTFKNITGTMNLNKGTANIEKILVEGELMSYYVKGKYNILPNTAYMVILGRLDSSVVSTLGILGQLSADKLLSYIPSFGPATANILKQLTSDPKNENTQLIPQLTNGSKNYKDFKVIFNGPVGPSSSVKNFKWLSKCDTSKIDITKEFQNAKQSAKDNINNQINSIQNSAQAVRTNVNNIVETKKSTTQQTIKDIQNLKQNSAQNALNLSKLLINAASNSNQKVNTENNTENSKADETNDINK